MVYYISVFVIFVLSYIFGDSFGIVVWKLTPYIDYIYLFLDICCLQLQTTLCYSLVWFRKIYLQHCWPQII